MLSNLNFNRERMIMLTNNLDIIPNLRGAIRETFFGNNSATNATAMVEFAKNSTDISPKLIVDAASNSPGLIALYVVAGILGVGFLVTKCCCDVGITARRP